MNRSIVSAIALVGGIAIAAPAAFGQGQAQSVPAAPQAGAAQQESAPAAGPGGMGMMGGQGMGMRGGMAGNEEMSGHGMGPWGHGMGWRRAMRRRSPAERCQDRLARRAAMIAYTVTKLDLTAQQRPIWDKLNAVVEAGTQKEQQLCNSLKANAQPGQRTILDRIDRREQFLSAQLQTIQKAKPLLQQFYQALTPQQQAIINHPFRRG